MIKKLILFFLLVFLPHASWSAENWILDKEKNLVYSVFETVDEFQWHTFVVCQVNPKEMMFRALIPYSEYKQYYTANLSTELHYKGHNLVRHDSFFWGNDNSPVKVEIDGKPIDGFVRLNSYEVEYKGNQIESVIQKLKQGGILKINKHFWHESGQKKYPKFSLNGFNDAFSKLALGEVDKLKKEYPLTGLRCKKEGNKKIIWINTSHGSYALNGSAIDWVNSVKKTGEPLLGSDGKPMKIGRNHIPPNELHTLIEEGLKLCD